MRHISFSEYFELDKSQYELDFIDVPINNGDISLFIDPFAISGRVDPWSIDCNDRIITFFQEVVDSIRSENHLRAKEMLGGLREPNQTRLGLSRGEKPRGRGVGGTQAFALYTALAGSSALKTGFLKDLQECELMIDGFGPDKISDIATNIIREKLIEYTQEQCRFWEIPLHQVASGPIWKNGSWTSEYVLLPVCMERSVLLVPKGREFESFRGH